MMETLETWDTEYSADSVEWCPISPFERLFVCGTYQISQEDSSQNGSYMRLGRLYLLEVDSKKKLRCLQTFDTPAILDTKWCPRRIDDMILLAVANAAGNVQV
ncbi:Diphthine methyltransferase [Blattella germanica]|nr:Diphthine methyltransferase [Blattella germanica]